MFLAYFIQLKSHIISYQTQKTDFDIDLITAPIAIEDFIIEMKKVKILIKDSDKFHPVIFDLATTGINQTLLTLIKTNYIQEFALFIAQCDTDWAKVSSRRNAEGSILFKITY